jgi:hypothetical protein
MTGVLTACEANLDKSAFFDDDYDDDDDDDDDDVNKSSTVADHCAQVVGYNGADNYWIVSGAGR